tara:strand:+ start:9007 stop:9936 length:930 start_codon:yes stop_codon:yes gene_type:complete
MAEARKSFGSESDDLDIDVGENEAAEVEVESFGDDSSGDDSSNEQEDYQGAAQKRINRLTKKMRDAERREQEAIRYAQQVTQETQTLQARMKQLDTGYLHEYGGRLDIETKTAEGALKRAVEIGDADGVIEHQRKLNQLYGAGEKYREAKRGQEMRESQAAQQQQYVQQPQYAPQQQPQPQQQQVVRPDPKAENWAEKNSWFGQDEAMTFAAFGIHKKLIEEEGFDPQADDYYSELDQRLRKRFPQELSSTPANDSGSSRRPVQTVAGVSRSNGNTTGRSRKVRLTPTQVAIAKKLGVPLEEYAKYVKD